MIWIRYLLWKWRTRNYTPEQRKTARREARDKTISTIREVKEAFKDEPATREHIEVFENLDKMCKELESD